MPLLEELGYMPSEKYARAKELLAHSAMIGRHFNLYPKTLFQTEVKSLTWDDDAVLWTVSTSRNDNIKTRFVIPAAGPLHRPKLPGVPGIKEFKGKSFHSSRWDYGYTGGDSAGGLKGLRDKRVGIIGTGEYLVFTLNLICSCSERGLQVPRPCRSCHILVNGQSRYTSSSEHHHPSTCAATDLRISNGRSR
jgi:Flavin-binding monooxygenase-like